MSTNAIVSNEDLTALPPLLSAPRLSTYLGANNGDKQKALLLYNWNLEVSAAFMVPIHILEVVLRNGISDAITAVHGDQWPWTEGFLRTLPNPGNRAVFNPQLELRACGRRHTSVGKVVADLKFVFWEKMLQHRHQRVLWSRELKGTFPEMPNDKPLEELRERLLLDIGNIRELRNRIAHHEPIFTRDLKNDLSKMVAVVGWRDPVAAKWMERMETVSTQLAKRPS